jgi:CRP/FNR family transcriptional regulator, cyclic AMP receptor protein
VLTDDDRLALAAAGRTTRWRAGTVLFREGEDPAGVFYVLEGRVKVHVTTARGNEVLLAVKEAGDLLGEVAAIDRGPRSASATVLDDLVAVVTPAARFRELARTRPGIGFALYEAVARQLRAATADLVARADGTVAERVAARLLALSQRVLEHDGPAVAVPLRIGHDDLASWTGASREAVSRAIAELRRVGAITTRPGRITVLDPDLLRGGGAAGSPAPPTV